MINKKKDVGSLLRLFSQQIERHMVNAVEVMSIILT